LQQNFVIVAEQIAHSTEDIAQKNEYQTVRVVFVGGLFVFDYLISATDYECDRISANDPKSPSSKTCNWSVLCTEI